MQCLHEHHTGCAARIAHKVCCLFLLSVTTLISHNHITCTLTDKQPQQRTRATLIMQSMGAFDPFVWTAAQHVCRSVLSRHLRLCGQCTSFGKAEPCTPCQHHNVWLLVASLASLACQTLREPLTPVDAQHHCTDVWVLA